MNEVKSPKKPLIYYYMIVVLLVLLFNLLAMPWPVSLYTSPSPRDRTRSRMPSSA